MAFLTRSIRLAVAALVIAAHVLPGAAASRQQALTEAQAKAGFLYNCAMFVSWPGAATDADLVIGIAGDAAVSAVMEDMQGRRVDGRTLRVVRVRPGDDLGKFHIVFVAGGDSRAVKHMLGSVGAAPVLTVGESDDFTSVGGVVRLYTDHGRLRFEINTTRVERTGLKVSAKMLGLAKIVR